MNQLPNYKRRTREDSQADVHNNKGVDLCLQGDFDAGIAEFGKAIQTNPNYPLAFFNRAITFARLGLKKSTFVDFETVRLIMRNFNEQITDADLDTELIEEIESIFGISTC